MPLFQHLRSSFDFVPQPKFESIHFNEKSVCVTLSDYTSYFANIKNLPEYIVPISICGKAPVSWNGLQFKKLAPKWWFFKQWKETGDNDFYIENFKKEILSKLNPHEVWNELKKLSNGSSFALICYEKPKDFCHRHLVSAWFRENGYSIQEF